MLEDVKINGGESLIHLALRSLIMSGPLGTVLIVMLWNNFSMQERMFTVIENNTKALVISATQQGQVTERMRENGVTLTHNQKLMEKIKSDVANMVYRHRRRNSDD